MKHNENTTDREIRISRLLAAPRETVWEVWTHPEHIQHWWGPEGFTNTIETMDVTPGGVWKFTMHGPDGKNYPNKSIYREVVQPERIVFDHIAPNFTATILFEAQGQHTLLTWHMVFESRELFEQVVTTFKADEGLKQNVDKLAAYLVPFTHATT